MERVGLAVLADVIGLCNGGHGSTVCIHLHQAVGVIGDDLKGGAVGGHLRVQRLDLGLQHDVQGAAGSRASSCGTCTGSCGRSSSRGAGRTAAGRQGQSSSGDTCSSQEAAARNTTIESHNIFSPLFTALKL